MTIRSFAAITALLAATSGASAANFSFTGNFGHDNSVFSSTFTLASPGTVSLVSLGYAGGTNSGGKSIAGGGFDTVLSLYDFATGEAISFNDDGAGAPVDSTGHASDAIITAALAAGTYKVFLSQYNNTGPASLPGTFGFAGQPDFRGGFIDFYGNQRDSHYALDVRGVDTAVPEVATSAMLLAGLSLLSFAARRRAA